MHELIQLAEKRLVLARHQLLRSAGEVDTNVYHVESGSLRIFVLHEEEERIIRFGYKDNLIVAMDSFLTGMPSRYYIEAIKQTRLRVIARSKMDEFLAVPAHQRWWMEVLAQTILQQLEREQDLLTDSPMERYLRVLRRSPQLFQEIPHKYIANYLRMTPETLSRLKKS